MQYVRQVEVGGMYLNDWVKYFGSHSQPARMCVFDLAIPPCGAGGVRVLRPKQCGDGLDYLLWEGETLGVARLRNHAERTTRIW